jgi:hypothetical protein
MFRDARTFVFRATRGHPCLAAPHSSGQPWQDSIWPPTLMNVWSPEFLGPVYYMKVEVENYNFRLNPSSLVYQVMQFTLSKLVAFVVAAQAIGIASAAPAANATGAVSVCLSNSGYSLSC